MSYPVDPTLIEGIVGVPRHARAHYGRAVSAEQMFYILHSKNCLEDHEDLGNCEFSLALDNGISGNTWKGLEDRPVVIVIDGDGLLAPALVG